MKKRIPSYEEFVNEFGPLAGPQRGSLNNNTKRVSYPVKTIKVGDTYKALRDTNILFNKGDNFEIVDVKTARELGSIGNSLVFFVKLNGKLNTAGKPFEVDQGEIELALGK